MLDKLKAVFKKDTKWQDMYEEKRKECQKWEFKFNKLSRQLQAILEEANSK